MVNITEIDPVNDSRWDKFVEEHPLGWIVHLSRWKLVLEECFPHMKGHFLALVDSASNEISAGLPCYEVRSWLLGNRLISIPAATISNPLISTAEQADKLFAASLDLAKSTGIKNIQIRTLHTDGLIKKIPFSTETHFVHHYLPLDRELAQIKKLFHYKSVQYEINKSAKKNLRLRVAEDESDIRSFYALYLKTRKRLGLPPQPYRFFKRLWDVFSPTMNVRVLLALSEGTAVAGHFLFLFNGRVSAEAAGWDIESKSSPNHFLFWEGIKLASLSGYRIFDFGRTSIVNESLMRFKKRWGTKEETLPCYFYPAGFSGKDSSRENSALYKMMHSVCEKSPEALFPLIGRLCYRHLG